LKTLCVTRVVLPLFKELEGLKRLDGGTIHLPSRVKDRPDRDRLALRFERFKAVA
jgi:putative restriction endonuclease